MDYSLCCHILLHSLCVTLPLSTAFTLVCFFFLSFFFSLLYSALKPSCQINPQITNLSTKCVSNVKKIHYSKLLKKCGRSCLRLFVWIGLFRFNTWSYCGPNSCRVLLCNTLIFFFHCIPDHLTVAVQKTKWSRVTLKPNSTEFSLKGCMHSKNSFRL